VDTDWHFDTDASLLHNYRVLIVQLGDMSPLTVFNLDITDVANCTNSKEPEPNPVCGVHGGIGSAVYFADPTCHRAPLQVETPRLIMVARIKLHQPSIADYDAASAYSHS
jgi:hypothetical protein